jgi:23S rRNA (adenine2503-C2)-methyltransferase
MLPQGSGMAELTTLPPDLLGLTLPRLREELGAVVDRPFRVAQIYHALYRRGIRDFAEITELDKTLRARLSELYRIGWPATASQDRSSDGTTKYLFRLHDGATIEAVDIPESKRRTFCLSSQAGCALACGFCVTGYWGAGRNLSPGEIVGQALAMKTENGLAGAGLRLVFMGMGEPLLNLDNVRDAIEILSESISLRRITVSTAGILPGIEAIASWPRRPNLAISLHAPDDARRTQVMPINRTYPLDDLLDTLRRYPLERGRRITFEYILIRGFNDAPSDATALARLLTGIRAKVNLIPINPDPVLGSAMVAPSDAAVQAFRERLIENNLTATVRRQRGDDVSGACGQLRAFGRDPRGLASRPGVRPSK